MRGLEVRYCGCCCYHGPGVDVVKRVMPVMQALWTAARKRVCKWVKTGWMSESWNELGLPRQAEWDMMRFGCGWYGFCCCS